MNPRQRRGVMLMILAGLGAIVIFIMIIGYVGNVQSQADARVGEMTNVLQLQADLDPYQPVTPDTVKTVQIPKRWVTGAFIQDLGGLQGKVAATKLPAGAYLQQGMVVDAPALKPGQREIAIMIDAETGVAGKVLPGSVVDVYSSFDATQANGAAGTGPCAIRILNRVQVINVGQLRASTDKQSGGGSVVPVTFALDPDETLRLTYAESFAKKVRLALVGGSQDPAAPTNRLCQTPSAGK